MRENEKLENEKDEAIIKYIIVEEDPSSPEKIGCGFRYVLRIKCLRAR